MAINFRPKIESFTLDLQNCSICKKSRALSAFPHSNSPVCPNHVFSVCGDCADSLCKDEAGEYEWNAVDKLCQVANIPFIPGEWTKFQEMSSTHVFLRYSKVFASQEYEGLDWSDYFSAYKVLKERNLLEQEIPLLSEENLKKLKLKWGPNYDAEALEYLEQLFNGLLATQSVNGKLQVDQALKICKISYEIDRRIEEGSDFDKLLASYDRLVKDAEFTPKNTKNINDFDTFGEAIKWMEKKGWRNKFYDNVSKDIVDETIANYQNFVRRLYTNESTIGDEITKRLETLKNASELENQSSYYNLEDNYDLDKFDNEAMSELYSDSDDFLVELEGNDG